MTNYKVEKFSNQNELALRACQTIASLIDLALDERDRTQIALSGGSTPEETYLLLGQEHLPWNRVDLFLGDERWVDPNSQASNARLLRRTLLLSGPGSACRFHAVPTIEMQSPEASSEVFSDLLKKICLGDPPIFDLILLGLGDDGHTASLFPGSHSLSITDRWTAVANAKGHQRITLTAPVISAARKVIFLVSGSSKQIPLKRLLDSKESIERTPAKLIQPKSEILILADEQAAALI